MQNWFENVLTPTVKNHSLQGYQSYLKKHLIPNLGDYSIQKLTPAVLDNFVRKLFADGYSKNTISQIHALMHHALDYVVYPAEIISSNPANYIKVPKKAPTNIVKRHIITPEKFAKLLAKYPFGNLYHIPILILYHTRMRINEVLGWTWNNIDFKKKIITVEKQIIYFSRRGYFFITPKTKSSHSHIVTYDFLAGELQLYIINAKIYF